MRIAMRPGPAIAIFLVFAAALSVLPGRVVAADTIQWHDYEAGLNMSSANGTPAMLDFSTSWCSWCKKMDADTYSDERVINLSGRFVCIRVDGDARGDLDVLYKVDGYPTTVFLNANGTEKHRVTGYEGPDDFLKDMAFALGEGPGPAATKGACTFALAPILIVIPALVRSRRRAT
jgi:thiol:disulfide interchange protein